MILLVILGIVIFIGLLTFVFTETYEERRKIIIRKKAKAALTAITVTSIISTIFMFIAILISYSTYIDNLVGNQAKIEQYREAITVYKDHSVISINKLQATFTDLKYQGYQENMSAFIKDLRTIIANYNSVFEKKKALERGIFGLLIITPDESMKPIKLIRGNQKKKYEI